MSATVNVEVCQSQDEATTRKQDLEGIGFRVTLVPGTPTVADILYVRNPGSPDALPALIDSGAAPWLLVAVK